MLCSLGDFIFESQEVNLANIKRKSIFSFANNPLLSHFDNRQATGRYEQSLTLSGKLIQKENNALHQLHQMAEQKKPLTLAFSDGRASTVLIQEINTEQSHFLKNGQFLKQDFEISLGVIHGKL